MTHSIPALVQAAERLLVDIEQAVRRFSRFNKYTFGTELRTAAMKVAKLSSRVWRDINQRVRWLDALVWAVDDLRQVLQLGSKLKAFASFAQYEMLARLLNEVGKQVGGWKKEVHLKGQNPAAPTSAVERPQELSNRAAQLLGAK